MRNQALLSLAVFCIGLWVAYQVGQRVAAEDVVSIELTVLGFAGCVAAVAILRRWRSGFYMFMVWLLFEDLVRRYMGNGLALFFGKDISTRFRRCCAAHGVLSGDAIAEQLGLRIGAPDLGLSDPESQGCL